MTVRDSLVLAVILIFTTLLILSGRPILKWIFSPLRRLTRVVAKYVVRPLYDWTLRPILRGLRRAFGFARGIAAPLPHGAPAQLGAAPYKAVVHLLEMNSQANLALGEVPAELKAHVERHGLLFRTVNANRAADELHGSLSADDARRNDEFAETFYERKLGQDISPGILYEDSEETLVINMLRETDQAFFYVLRRFNRNVSRNALKIISLMTAIVVIFPFVATAFASWIEAHGAPGNAVGSYILMCLLFLASLPIWRMFHTFSARNNGTHLNYFVQTYFGRLLSQYQSAAAAFANVLNDRALDLETVKDNGDMWFVNLHWLSIRQWFLELYVRNIFFQIGRNLWWYYLSVPVFFLIVVPVAYFDLLPAIGWITGGRAAAPDIATALGAWVHRPDFWMVAVPFGALFAIYCGSLTELLSQFWYEIRPDGWLGFRAMHIKAAIEGNLGPIVKEVVDKRRNPYGQQQSFIVPPRA